MEIIVQKYGGTSVADTEKLLKVCNHITREKDNGKDVVVVVSAQGRTTDNLIDEEREITFEPNKREHDVLVSVGEQITIAKLAMHLENLGYPAISYLGWQVPIKTDSNFGDASIKSVGTKNILKDLKQNKIVIVAGFQGIDDHGNVTTLGRGGSDTTAVALADALKAKTCEIYTDVDGIYSEDPNINPNAIKFDEISYDKMLDMSNAGAQVLHSKCIEFAKQKLVKIIVKSTFKPSCTGTLVDK